MRRLLVLLALLTACQAPVPPAPTTTVPPSSGDSTAALQAALDSSGSLYVDTAYIVDGTLKPPAGSTITFGPHGLFRRTATPNAPHLAMIEMRAGGVTLNRPRLIGPNGCYWSWPYDPPEVYTYSQYDPKREWNHGISILGGSSYRIVSPSITGMWGDGINIDGTPSQISITDMRIECVGRSIISNTGSTDVTVAGGSVRGAFWWTFNVEPYVTRSVRNYTITDVDVGWSRAQYLYAGGPDFSCLVDNVTLTDVRLTSPSDDVYIAPCVAGEIIIK